MCRLVALASIGHLVSLSGVDIPKEHTKTTCVTEGGSFQNYLCDGGRKFPDISSLQAYWRPAFPSISCATGATGATHVPLGPT
eukprot:scaffold91900_cov59-Attheya_sp.AAC.4